CLLDAITLLAGQSADERGPDALVRGTGELQILPHRMVHEHGGLLKLAPDAAIRDLGLAELEQVDASAEIGGAFVRACLARDDVHHRRLTGTVRPDDAAQLADVDIEAELVQGAEAV